MHVSVSVLSVCERACVIHRPMRAIKVMLAAGGCPGAVFEPRELVQFRREGCGAPPRACCATHYITKIAVRVCMPHVRTQRVQPRQRPVRDAPLAHLQCALPCQQPCAPLLGAD